MATQRNYAQQMDAVLAGLGGTRPRLLLHACCGPCSSAVLEQLCRYFEITVLYYNPNTWPAAAAFFLRRLFQAVDCFPQILPVCDFRPVLQ